MHQLYISLTILLLVFGKSLFAQVGKRSNFAPGNQVTKGYYSIGNNPERLYKSFSVVPDTVTFHSPSKGYYSLQSASNKLPVKKGWFRKDMAQPVITKGYYSIGNNAEKLHNFSK